MTKSPDPYCYVAKYVAKQGGDLHFGGTLANVNFSDFRKSLKTHGRPKSFGLPLYLECIST